MAEKPSNLGDFFAKKKKKAPKGSNMNNEASTTKVEEKKTKSKDKEEEGWEDEQIVAPTMNIEMAGRLTREEESKDQEDSVAPAWGSTKQKSGGDHPKINEKRFPTLAKSVGQSSNINIDDGSQNNINIKTTKNMFAQLGDDGFDEDDGPKRPKEIKPAMVKKAQGEREKEALQREVDKYTKKDDKKAKKKKKADSEEEDEEDEEEEEDEVEDIVAKKNNKKDVKKPAKAKETTAQKEEEVVEAAEDTKIVPDEVASRAKYIGREKLEVVPVPARDLKEESKQNDSAASKKKGKKNAFMEEEEKGSRKLLVADWDD